MDQDLINKVITVSGKEEKMQGGKPVMKIKDQDNLTYTVYKIKQDGTESAAWKAMPSLEDVVQIGFVEQKGEYEGKPVTYRTIRVFNKDIGNGVANLTPRQERFVEGASVNMKLSNPLYDKPKEEPKDDKFWDMKAYKQCLWGLWLEQNKDRNMTDWKTTVWTTFKEIEQDANKRFFEFSLNEDAKNISSTELTGQEKAKVLGDDLPTIQVQGVTAGKDFNVEENISEEWDKTYNCTVCGTQGATHGDGHDCIPF